MPAEQKRTASLTVFREAVRHLKKGITRHRRLQKKKPTAPSLRKFRKQPLTGIDLTRRLEINDYQQQLKIAQRRVRELEYHIFHHRLPVTIVYQGWDAAGKGGNIKRLTQRMDPRGYEVIPIGAPTRDELAHHYLWRFWKRVPKAGHIAIFDSKLVWSRFS